MATTPDIQTVTDHGQLCLRSVDGALVGADGVRWLDVPSPEEETVLDLARGPVLDIGCGPGRHILALTRRGVAAMGLDITPAAVRVARSRGALVLQRSVFDRLPARGRWATALLLDGNVGIGGDVPALLRRVATLLRPGGRILAELDGPHPASGAGGPHPASGAGGPGPLTVRLEHAGDVGPWFGWARASIDRLPAMARAADLALVDTWSAGGRWFARLDRRWPPSS